MNDDFEAFLKKREEALLTRIEAAMGKTINRESSPAETSPDFPDYESEEETEE